MRAWLPERQVYGPEPAGERDTEGLNRVFADAFTDRYRRDGLVGVRVPHLNPQVWHAHSHERSEEHTSELQSRLHLVCRLLLEKKKTKHITTHQISSTCMP